MDYASEYDDASDNDLTVTTSPGQDATIEQLREMLKKEQLKNQKIMENNKKLRSCEGNVGVSKAGKKGGKSRTDADIPVQLVDHVEQITRLGKKGAVMLALWIPDEVFTKKRPTFDYKNGNQRYANPENEIMALISELYDFIPEEYHAFCLRLPKFGEIYKTGSSACRSSVLYNIRSKAASIFSLDGKYFCGEHSVKDCVEILDLLGYDKAKGTYDTWPPILYPNNVKNKRQPFRNAALPLILKIALHGAGALNSVGKGKPKVNAQLWGVTSVNESAIAFSAIMARFVLSTDTEIAIKGSVTGIKYQVDYWKYRRMLAKADEAARQNLIDFFNETVFPSRSSISAKKKERDEDEDEDLTDAIAAFNLGPGEAGVDDDSDHAVPPVSESFSSSNLGNTGESLDDQHHDHGDMVELLDTTRKSKRAPANKSTVTPRVGRLKKGVTDERGNDISTETAIEKGDVNDKRTRDRGNKSKAVDSSIPAQKPIRRKSNVVVSDEENESVNV